MPLIPEEPQIHESAQGPRVTPAAGRTASTPRPVPGPRSAATPRPGRPGPGPARPAPPAQRPHPTPGRSRTDTPENRSAPQIQLIPASAAGALDAADEAVDLLLDSGRAPGDILVLTTGEQHPWAAHELTFGEAAYWAQHETGDDVFFAGAEAADRLRTRPVVIVAVNGGDTVADVLTGARERAGALLIVCGDPQRINAVLGAAV
ncbi:hypothetical protein OG887_30690 [Streptomyces sp. NBC_00053]|uniref:hypothetical protein n=1 Tax=unclassified Streptomyces TaxID=2593676 RepID=UPI000F5BF268|nr:MULTISPECIES: hypothetical protein [unclassified Streptomyces]WSG53854.1 hypothetical protein OHA38_30955 [Streptomyces sp. NBC_01732]WSX04491.1 hypothetical protein OG355_30955 [Streptomyces sp. NBC_00987]MCX5105362.1 hypothetical protein [Streptomyces sp. NBC_00439]MCX5163483.1 hypothetical protein [Streptomyces sp. NBC_00305]MCX5222007.1 hypothetical protein [Streptomyces sp. NBC_00264]